MAGADPDDVRDGGPCHENADNAVTASLSDVRLTSYGNGKYPDMDCIAPCHVRTIGQKTVSNALANCYCSCHRLQESNVCISVRLEITE